MNTTHRLPPSDLNSKNRIFRTSNISIATDTLITKLQNGWSMSNILQSFYPEEIEWILWDIRGNNSNISNIKRRFLLKHSDASLGLSQEEIRHKKLILVIDFMLYGDGDVTDIFQGLLDLTHKQLQETIDLYYADYAHMLDTEKLIAGIRSIRNGRQTRESYLKII